VGRLVDAVRQQVEARAMAQKRQAKRQQSKRIRILKKAVFEPRKSDLSLYFTTVKKS
jgi:hypothetical protein